MLLKGDWGRKQKASWGKVREEASEGKENRILSEFDGVGQRCHCHYKRVNGCVLEGMSTRLQHKRPTSLGSCVLSGDLCNTTRVTSEQVK